MPFDPSKIGGGNRPGFDPLQDEGFGRGPGMSEDGTQDQFEKGLRLPRFMRAIQEKLGTGYRNFKLPGTNRVVEDNRDRAGRRDDTGKKDAGYEIRDGKMIEVKNVPQTGEGAAADLNRALEGEVNRLLSDFEKMLVERFEKGKQLEYQTKDGKPNYAQKAEGAWKAFFSKFVKRTIWKKGELENLKEFVFRGLMSHAKGGGKYSTLIGDMAYNNGQIQKFTRLQILNEIAKMLQNIKPGSALAKDLLKKGLEAEEFQFLALANKHRDKALKLSQQEAKGFFGTTQKAEDQAAEKLGLKRRGGRGKYGGPIRWGKEGASEEPHLFVPLGFWEREKRGAWPRLIIKIAVILTGILILAGLYTLAMKFL